MSRTRGETRFLVGAAVAIVVLAGLSTVALVAARGASTHRESAPNGECSAPKLAGTVVDVTLTNMGGGMMQGSGAGGMMRVLMSSDQVGSGTVSFRVANTGSLVHELVVLLLAPGHQVGDRTVSSGGRVAETGSIGEASHTCGAGAGDGINPGAIGWVTLHLQPGNYELVCNLVGHYAAGMYTELTVT